jgi:hypothetical protein
MGERPQVRGACLGERASARWSGPPTTINWDSSRDGGAFAQYSAAAANDCKLRWTFSLVAPTYERVHWRRRKAATESRAEINLCWRARMCFEWRQKKRETHWAAEGSPILGNATIKLDRLIRQMIQFGVLTTRARLRVGSFDVWWCPLAIPKLAERERRRVAWG